MRVLKPDTETDVASAIREAAHMQTPLAVEGGGTKRHWGRAVANDTVLKLGGLAGITMYEPDEMVFTAKAGTPLAEVEAMLAAKGQCLAFEPASPPNATLGGVIAANVAGPRRFASGAARDHLLGFAAIDGKGERFKAGGRVVKNVTGYDMPKLAAGSFGTLFVMTELTLRALPRGACAYLAVDETNAAKALHLLRRLAASPFDPTGLAYLPARGQALIRLEGQADGVIARRDELKKSFAPSARVLDDEEGAKLFASLTEVAPHLRADGERWRLSIPPARSDTAIARLAPSAWFADGAGAFLWLENPKADVHEIARDLGGHAMLVGARTLRDDIFSPLDETTERLTRRVKHAFDSGRILNPGRMYKDI